MSVPKNKLTLNPNLKEFWSKYYPIKCLYGGRDSSKTKDTAIWLLVQSMNYRLRIMCVRQFQNRIEQSVYTELKWVIDQLGVQQLFKITNNKIICTKTGSEFFFYGIKRNLTDIKGTADIDILWIEEGEDLTQEQFDLIEPTIRKDGSFIIILFNPKLQTDYIWQDLVLSGREDVQTRLINYNENVFLSEKSKKRIEQLKTRDYEAYEHIYLGVPKKDDKLAIIKRVWLNAIVDAHKKLNVDLRGYAQIGYDVADAGDDKNAVCIVEGTLLTYIEEWKAKEDELVESSLKVYQLAYRKKAQTIYDTNGVGAGTGSNYKRFNKEYNQNLTFVGFNSASSPVAPKSFYEGDITNEQYFENLKAQAWWEFRDRVIDTYNFVVNDIPCDIDRIVAIDSSTTNIAIIEKLITELSTPRMAQSARLKNMVEKKKDLEARGVKSPNLADACVMAFTRLLSDKLIVRKSEGKLINY